MRVLVVSLGLVCVSLAHAKSPSAEDAAYVLQAEASLSTHPGVGCDEGRLRDEENVAANSVESKSMMAYELSTNAAHNVASCLLVTHMPLPASALRVGDLLALFLTAAKDAGSTLTDEVRQEKNHAGVLLRFAAENGESAAKLTLAKYGLTGEDASPRAVGTSAAELTARAAVEAYEGNLVGFDLKYKGKLIGVTGPVQGVSAIPGGGAAVSISGIDRGERGV